MRKPAVLIFLVAIGLSACSAQQLYDTGRAWRASLCDGSVGDDRIRCEADAGTSYAQYKQQTATPNNWK